MLLVKDLSLFNGKKISLTLDAGGEYVLRGSNGSGKTLLLRTLAGLYPGSATEFFLSGKRLEDFSPEEYRSRVLYVSPVTAMSPELTAEAFMAAPFKLSIYRGRKSSFAPEAFLKEWGISGKTLAHLSSGQKQLLALLRVLTLDAEILLLDEPTSHMDQEKTLIAEKLLRDWRAMDPKRIILIVTHSDVQAKRFGKRINFEDIISAK